MVEKRWGEDKGFKGSHLGIYNCTLETPSAVVVLSQTHGRLSSQSRIRTQQTCYCIIALGFGGCVPWNCHTCQTLIANAGLFTRYALYG